MRSKILIYRDYGCADVSSLYGELTSYFREKGISVDFTDAAEIKNGVLNRNVKAFFLGGGAEKCGRYGGGWTAASGIVRPYDEIDLKTYCWQKEYYVDTEGKNTKKIKEYIQHQLEEDAASEQLTHDLSDPFTGNK